MCFNYNKIIPWLLSATRDNFGDIIPGNNYKLYNKWICYKQQNTYTQTLSYNNTGYRTSQQVYRVPGYFDIPNSKNLS